MADEQQQMADELQPTEKNPIQILGYKERWKAEDGTTFERNLDTRGKLFTWLYAVRKGRFSAKVLRKEVIRAVPSERNEGGFFAEQVNEYLLNQLEMGYKKGSEWEHIRFQFYPQEGGNLQTCLDALHTARHIFSDDNPREQVR